MAVHKKLANTETQKKTEAQSDKKIGQEPIVVSDVVTETTEKVEIIEEVSPQAKLGTSTESPSSADPLTEFKEKMTEEEKSPISDTSSKKNYMWPILLVFIITILLLVGVFLYRNETNTGNKINVVTLSPTPATAAPEPTRIIDLAKYEIEILNGSGIDGEASRQKASLTAEGFTISSVGNADNSDYIDTIIKAKAEVNKDFIARLKNVLNSSFTVGEAESLSENSSVPVVVIIGTKK